MALRYSTLFSGILVLLVLTTACLGLHSLLAVVGSGPVLASKAELVRSLQLTDLCLFTEASYTRHLAMTDRNTPFQDSPLAFEHFPTGSLVAPPDHLTAAGATRMTVRKHGQRI
jgi:hypothetical protein